MPLVGRNYVGCNKAAGRIAPNGFIRRNALRLRPTEVPLGDCALPVHLTALRMLTAHPRCALRPYVGCNKAAGRIAPNGISYGAMPFGYCALPVRLTALPVHLTAFISKSIESDPIDWNGISYGAMPFGYCALPVHLTAFISKSIESDPIDSLH